MSRSAPRPPAPRSASGRRRSESGGWFAAFERVERLALTLAACVAALGLEVVSGGRALASEEAPASAEAAPADAAPAPEGPAIVTRDTFVDLAERTLPSVVAVYVKTTLRDQLEEMRKRDPNNPLFDERMRKFLEEPEPGEEGEEGSEGAPGGDPHAGMEEIRTSGSGVVISADGYVVTNYHIIQTRAGQVPEGSISVVLHDDTEIPGDKVKVVAVDELIDLAVLKIEAEGLALKPLPWGDSDAMRIGDFVVAIGNPLDLRGTVSTGIVSAKARQIDKVAIEHLIQTDAMINPGNSGGALVNLEGELIGINMAIATNSGFFQGIGFAIPSNDARFVCDQVIEHGRVRRGYIGIYMAPVEPSLQAALGLDEKIQGGILVTDVAPGAPAEKAGIKAYDVITAVDSRTMKKPNDLLDAIASKRVGDSAKIVLQRPSTDGPSEIETTMEVAERPSAREINVQADRLTALRGRTPDLPRDPATRLGLALEPFELQDIKGVEVIGVMPGSAAALADFRPGDIVLEIDLMPVVTVEEMQAALGAPGSRPRLVRAIQDGRYVVKALPAPGEATPGNR